MRLMHRIVIAVLGLVAWAGTANALTKPERELIVQSVRPSQLPALEAAVGRLDALPFLAMEVTLDVDKRTIKGRARLDWLNTTGVPQSKIPIRFTSHGGGKRAPSVGWSRVMVTLPEGKRTAATVKSQSKTVSWVQLPQALVPGERVIIEGELDGLMAKIAAGATDPMAAGLSALSGKKQQNQASGSQYGTFACGDGICTMAGFAPEVPAFMDGKFDTVEGTGIGDATYSDVTNLLLSVIAPKDVVIAATGLPVGQTSEGNNYRTTFAMAATREVGIVASRQFSFYEEKAGDVVVRSFALEADAAGGQSALASGVSALRILDEALGPYPWSFLNIAESALVGGAGGVEMPGLALGASGFYRPDTSMLSMLGGGDLFGDMLDFITRHEVAHQWWHAQVGSHAQAHPYVDEPLAQWSALHTVRKARGEAEAKKLRDLQIAMNFQALELMGIPDGKVARPAAKFHNSTEYAGLVYGKAPLFYEAVREEIGEAELLAGLRSLVATRRFRRAAPDDVVNALSDASNGKGTAVKSLWQRWFHEVHGKEDVGSLDFASIAGSLGIDGLDGASGTNPFQMLQQILDGSALDE